MDSWAGVPYWGHYQTFLIYAGLKRTTLMAKAWNARAATVWKWHLFTCCAVIEITPCFCFFSPPPVPSPASATEPDFKSKDWVFLNYTYKRFEGLTQRGTIPTYMKAGKAWRGTRPCCSGEPNTDIYGHRVRAPPHPLAGPAGAEGDAASFSV